MTVINMLSLGESGIAVADEQSSSFIRKYNVAQKLQLFDDKVVYGGSGPADIIREIYEQSKREIQELKKERGSLQLKDIYEIVSKVAINHKNQFKNRILYSNLGITLDDYITGTLSRNGQKLDEHVKAYAGNAIQKIDEEWHVAALLGGFELNGDSQKFSIYGVDARGFSFKISRPYGTIGSGADESDKVLSSYIANLKRDKREKIAPHEGLAKIIEATNASARLNVGVGGTFSIVYINPHEVIIPSEDNCILATEVVQGLTHALLDKDLAYNMLERLIFKQEDFEVVEEELKTGTKDWKLLDRFLRGYKE